MKTIGQRLSLFIERLGISKNEFARQVGISSSVISNITSQDVSFRIDILQKIMSKYPTLNIEWLLTNMGDMILENPAQKPNHNPTENPTGHVLAREREHMFNFIESLNSKDLEQLLSHVIDEMKYKYEDYRLLVNSLPKLGAPKLILEKYPIVPDFNNMRKRNDEEFEEIHKHLTDKNLLNVFRIKAYREIEEYYSHQLSTLIMYISKYSDFFNDTDADLIES